MDNNTSAVKMQNPFILTSGAFSPGGAEKFINSVQDKNKRIIAESELLYYKGRGDEAVRRIKDVCAAEAEADTKLAVYLIKMLSSVSTGGIKEIKETMNCINNPAFSDEASAQLKKTAEFLLIYFNIIIHNFGAIEFPKTGIDAFSVPEELKPTAVYVYSHYLEMTGNVGRAIGLAECALIFMKKPSPIAQIYLSLIISVGYMELKRPDKAEYYFRLAWEYAKPDGLLMPFAQVRGMLSGMLEKCLRYDCPNEYKLIHSMSSKYLKNWVNVHNEFTGDTLSDKLTTVEFNISMLASRSMTNTEIADFLGISVNSVRAHLRNIFNKLGISSRKQLGEYVITPE